MHINSYIRIPTPLWLYTRTIIEYKISGRELPLFRLYIFKISSILFDNLHNNGIRFYPDIYTFFLIAFQINRITNPEDIQ